MTTAPSEPKKPFFSCCAGEEEKKEALVDLSEKKPQPVAASIGTSSSMQLWPIILRHPHRPRSASPISTLLNKTNPFTINTLPHTRLDLNNHPINKASLFTHHHHPLPLLLPVPITSFSPFLYLFTDWVGVPAAHDIAGAYIVDWLIFKTRRLRVQVVWFSCTSWPNYKDSSWDFHRPFGSAGLRRQ